MSLCLGRDTLRMTCQKLSEARQLLRATGQTRRILHGMQTDADAAPAVKEC